MSKVEVNNGSDLTVDFGYRRSPSSTGGGGEVTARNTMVMAMTMERQVNFSEDVIVHCFLYPSRDEVSKRWHSRRDKYFFEQEIARDVRSIRCLLSNCLSHQWKK